MNDSQNRQAGAQQIVAPALRFAIVKCAARRNEKSENLHPRFN
ncbi:hypothetical protein BH09PLA1_BH09PLA1_08270 [soil metagenome]